ncbi:hypothetical protein [Dyadobacter luticola]|nr:hypothetical protein [Dyadobacter luticola]
MATIAMKEKNVNVRTEKKVEDYKDLTIMRKLNQMEEALKKYPSLRRDK